ncbi:MAG TPA: MlaD family protein [Ferrovibrio sp.]|uniref:MlaD family protein n=1 Tax=Ferrovibrio sp. TaxID=1917215 RepID=UPI002B4B56B0|nr:MlaD family protein [Ferrovibrio sp.]HLT78577.1 MlaD family protein [Ferrovibrio sp.]
METRAHHLLIGSFVLVFVAAMVMFTLWLAKVREDAEIARYNIYFTGSVAGLGVGGDVRFNGIKVGSVSQIVIDRDDTSRVRVTVEVDADTPIREDSEATLQLQGITGVSFVQILPGSNTAPILPVVSGSNPSLYPVIRSRPSAIDALFEAAPELLQRAAQVLSDENIANISGFMADLRQVSQILASRQESIGRAIDSFDRTSGDIAKAAEAAATIAARLDRVMGEAERMLGRANTMLDGDAAEALRSAKTAMAQLNGTLGEIQALVRENRAPIQAITTDGFGEFRRFVQEARILVGSLARVAQRLEDNPSAVLFGNRDAEYRGGGRQ